MKNYTEAERDRISRYALAAAARFARDNRKSTHREVTASNMISAAGLTIARWFSDDAFRPFDPDKGTTVHCWVSVVVIWSLRTWIQKTTGAKLVRPKPTFRSLEPWDQSKALELPDPVDALALADEIARVKRAATRKQWAVMSQFLKGHSWRGASHAAGLSDTAYFDHLKTLKRRLGQ